MFSFVCSLSFAVARHNKGNCAVEYLVVAKKERDPIF